MFSHRSADAFSDFIEIELENGATISATSGHFLWALSADNGFTPALHDNNATMLTAKEIQIGMVLPSVLAAGRAPAGSRVIRTRTMTQQGLFNPHTTSGSIVVNGVVAQQRTRLRAVVTG